MVDTDYGCTVEVTRNGEEEVIWDAHKIGDLLRRHRDSNLVISGCYSNQGDFYNYFDHIVLLVAELDVMLARVEKRTAHDFGKDPAERGRIISDHDNVLPLLRKRATTVIDTTNLGIQEVCHEIKVLLERSV